MSGDPVLIRAGEGEQIGEPPGRVVAIKADLPEAVIAEFRYPPLTDGADDHIHREHADCFYVLSGTLTLGIGGERVDVPAGGFALVPPEVVHSFRNDCGDEVRFLSIHAPGCGFADYLRGRNDGFDQFEPPTDGGRPASEALVRAPGDGEMVALAGGSRLILKATADDGLGSVTVDEAFLASNFPGVPPHRHRATADCFYVLDGALTVRLGDEVATARAGDIAVAPPEAVHGIGLGGDGPVHYVNVIAPGGLERFFREVASGRHGPDRLLEITSRYDIQPP